MEDAHYLVHVEPVLDEPFVGIARVFAKPLGKLDPEGMPYKPWLWSCLIVIRSGVGHIKAVMTRPPHKVMTLLRRRASDLGATSLQWDRARNGAVRVRKFST